LLPRGAFDLICTVKPSIAFPLLIAVARLREHSTSEINSVRLLTGNFATITVTGSEDILSVLELFPD
jgi:hypothetical protein